MENESDIRKQMERIYSDTPLADIPWNIAEPPKLLVEAVQSKKLSPGKVVDLGCGTGNYSVWLAEQGFDVTGIDISPEAVKHARELAASRGVECRFEAADLSGSLQEFHDQFDAAIGWLVLHHLFPEDRPTYIGNISNMLHQGGLYLSVSFSENDTVFEGEGKLRKTEFGTTLYFSSLDELTELFSPQFEILELKAVELKGKQDVHVCNVAWLQRK
jgi:cyclopropane fatty-acyl-phospholipid synthase-like methyltransferase